jgi:peptidoglycan-N-acetylglucosamine deacetylase
MNYLAKTPWWLRRLYPTCVWRVPTVSKTVYITFDDGPHPVATPLALQLLEQYNAKASFFCIGNNVQLQPSIYNTIIINGHAIGNHTMNHVNGWKSNTSLYLEEIEQAEKLIKTNFFRPPYGRIKRAQIRAIKNKWPATKIIMWSVLSGDFDTAIDGEKCYQNVINNIEPGSIIVFHDSEKALPRLQYALPRVLEWLQANGYEMAALK